MNNMQTVVVYQKGTNEIIACIPSDNSERIARKDVGIKISEIIDMAKNMPDRIIGED